MCGTIVEAALIGNNQVAGRIQYVQRAGVNDLRAALAAILGLDELIVADREYNTAPEGRTASYSPIFDDDLLIVARPTAPAPDMPAAGYSFCWDEGGKGDMYIESYRDETVKSDVYRGICHFDLKQVAGSLGVFFADCTD